MLEHLNLLLPIGADSPFKLLHASDTHITLADERDDERKNVLAAKRARVFPGALENLREIGETADREGSIIAYTGDLIDFVSYANLNEASAFVSKHDVFMAAGNHEFSQYVGEAFEDAAYRAQSLGRVQAAFSNDIRMSSRSVNGVNLVALDNSYYLFEKAQYDFLRNECAKGQPVILLLHTPLYTPELHRFIIDVRKQPCGYLCGSPEEELIKYPKDRCIQQKPDEATLETCAFIRACPNIRCILTGHIHATCISPLREDLIQNALSTTAVNHIMVS